MSTVKQYENNPFHVALSGLNLILEKAQGVAILLIILSILGVFSGIPTTPQDNKPGEFKMQLPSLSMEQWIMVTSVGALLFLAFVFVTAMISGISAYTSARLAKGHTVQLNEAFNAVLGRFFSFIWLQVIIVVKIILWSLLLVVPGVIMSYRYSLANVAFFDKNLTGNAAIKESLRMTKGAWLTTFASQVLFNIITLGVINEFVTAGARTVLYRQLSTIDSDKKPAAHNLSWLTLFLPLIIAVIFVSFAFGAFALTFIFRSVIG